MYEFTFEFRGVKDKITVEAEGILSAIERFNKENKNVKLSLITNIKWIY